MKIRPEWWATVVLLMPMPLSGANPPDLKDLDTTVTRSSVRVTWRTDVNATRELEWGLQAGLLANKIRDDRRGTTHALYATALAPDTLYYFRACSTDSIRVCSETKIVRTLPATGQMAAEALPPQREAKIEFTEADGKKLFVADDCSDLQARINEAAAADPNQTHEVVLQPGTICSGKYVLPERPAHATGWVIIRSADNEIPPPGGRMDLTFLPATPILAGNQVHARLLPYAPKDSCILGDFWWDIDERDFSLYRCTDAEATLWTKEESLGSGSQLPKTCASGDWFYKTDIPQHNQRAHWCVAENQWRNVEFTGGGFYFNWAVIQTAARARRYRLTGLTIQALPTPEKYVPIFSQATQTRRLPLGSTYGCLVSTRSDSDSIFFDRMIFDGIGYPTRTLNAFCDFDGSNISVSGSFFNEINTWVNPSISELSGSAIKLSEGPGPVRIENNYFKNNLGITIFHNDNVGTRISSSANDVLIRNNVFFEDPAYNAADPLSNGRYYYRRNILELKRGERWLIEGNQFLGGWAGVTGGSCLSFTPRPGSLHNLNSTMSIRDITIRGNLFRHCPETIAIVGFNDQPDATLAQAERMLIENNLVMYSGITPTGINKGWPGNRAFNGQFLIVQLGFQDLIIRANTIYESVGINHGANFITHLQEPANTGLEIHDNIYSVTGPGGTRSGIWGLNQEGASALNERWRAGASPAWQMNDNLIVRATGDNGRYPQRTFFARTSEDVGFSDDLSLLPSSRYRAGTMQASSKGVDLGVNIKALKQDLRLIEQLDIEDVQPTAVTFRYNYWTMQEEGAYCGADLSKDEHFLTHGRHWDEGRNLQRRIRIDQLTPGQMYYVRLLCPGQSIIGRFQTTPDNNRALSNSVVSSGSTEINNRSSAFQILGGTDKALHVSSQSKNRR